MRSAFPKPSPADKGHRLQTAALTNRPL